MNTDAYFAIGHTHQVCQDYACVGPDFAVLSDGCSSSPHTDFGARLLCRTAVLNGVGEAAATAASLLEPLALPTASLDATILLARWVPDADIPHVAVIVAGDGVVVGRRRDGGTFLLVSSFASGAPFYQSYGLNPGRLEGYLAEFGSEHAVTVSGDDSRVVAFRGGVDLVGREDGPARVMRARPKSPPIVEVRLPAAAYDLVLLMSDGALSFRRPASGVTEAVPLDEVVGEMLALKGMSGQFIARRAKRFLRDAANRGWHHDDDFSVAAMFLGEAP